MVEIFAVLLIGLVPPIVSLLVVRVAEERVRARLEAAVRHQSNLPAPAHIYLAGEGDRRFVHGVGYCMGNNTCRFNAHSVYLRCAVNPSGPCEGCFHYESIDFHQPSIVQL